MPIYTNNSLVEYKNKPFFNNPLIKSLVTVLDLPYSGNLTNFNGFFNYIGTNELSSGYVNPIGSSVTVTPVIENTNLLLDHVSGTGGWVDYGLSVVTLDTSYSVKINKLLIHYVAGLAGTMTIQQLSEGVWSNIGSIPINTSFTYQSSVLDVVSDVYVSSIRLFQNTGSLRLSEIEVFGELLL